MTYREFTILAAERLSELYPEQEAKAMVSRLLCHRLDIQPYKCIAEPQTEIPKAAMENLSSDLDQLAEGRPIQYVLGFTEFCGHRIRVKEGVLIPRPETEELAGRIIDECGAIELDEDQEFNILDMCTGSGCIAYALAAEFPSAQVYGCDISCDALKIACKQRVKLPAGRPVFFQADILQAPPAGLPQFDVIVSNPPYVREPEKAQMRPNVLEYEPSQALFVPDDDPLVFYRAIAFWASVLLKPKGRIYLEINEALGKEAASLFGDAAVLRDFNGKDRFVVLTR